MDFTLNDEQEALREAVRGLIGRRYDAIERRREVTATDPGYDPKTWAQLAELGALALPFPEELGGVGAGPLEVAVTAEELGRVLAPEPFVETVVLAGGLIAEAGSSNQAEELIAAIAGGEAIAAFAGFEPGHRWDLGSPSVSAVASGAEWRLTGVKEPVLWGAQADVLIVSAATPAGVGLFVVTSDASGLERSDYRTSDGIRAARVAFSDTPAQPLGAVDENRAELIERVLDRARLAYAHEAIALMERALELTTDYLRTRKQFGTTLNTFQALTHRAADMLVVLELARSTVLWASIVRDAEHEGDDTVDVAAAVSQAWLQVTRAAQLIGRDAIQLHGGIGMTAEYSVGHYTSRLVALERLYGDTTLHTRRLAAQVQSHDSIDPIG
jgi:alkylation response protein AidB-like acyl-CoA dehydrogenase